MANPEDEAFFLAAKINRSTARMATAPAGSINHAPDNELFDCAEVMGDAIDVWLSGDFDVSEAEGSPNIQH